MKHCPGPTELLQIMETRTSSSMPSILKTPTSDTTLLVLQPPQSHRMPPAEFSDNGGTLPRPPPPPKAVKPPPQAETQPLLAPHGSIQLISTHPGTLGRKHNQGKPMEELRVWQIERQVDFRCLANDLNRICDQLNRSKPEAEDALYHVWRAVYSVYNVDKDTTKVNDTNMFSVFWFFTSWFLLVFLMF